MWTYRLRLVRDVLIPLSKKSIVFKENLILKEISNMDAYIKQNKKDKSAKYYFSEIKEAMVS